MFKILSGQKYHNILTEQKQLQERCRELEKEIKTLTQEKEQLVGSIEKVAQEAQDYTDVVNRKIKVN